MHKAGDAAIVVAHGVSGGLHEGRPFHAVEPNRRCSSAKGRIGDVCLPIFHAFSNVVKCGAAECHAR